MGKSFRYSKGTGILVVDSVAKFYAGNSFYFSKDTLVATHSSFILPKGSPLLVSKYKLSKETISLLNNSPHQFVQARFTPSVMWLRDTGILDKMKFDVVNPNISVPIAKVRLNQPLILKQLGVIMIFLIVGLTIALIMFIMEFWMCKKTRGKWPFRSAVIGTRKLTTKTQVVRRKGMINNWVQ